MSKKLAPFGKKLNDLLKTGKKPKNNVLIFIGDYSWQKGSALSTSHYVLVLPPETENPRAFRWPVKGCLPLVFDTSNSEPYLIKKLAYTLLISGAPRVHVILKNGRQVFFTGSNNNE